MDLLSLYVNAYVCQLLFEPVDLLLEVETHPTHYHNDTAKYFCQGHGGTGKLKLNLERNRTKCNSGEYNRVIEQNMTWEGQLKSGIVILVYGNYR